MQLQVGLIAPEECQTIAHVEGEARSEFFHRMRPLDLMNLIPD